MTIIIIIVRPIFSTDDNSFVDFVPQKFGEQANKPTHIRTQF